MQEDTAEKHIGKGMAREREPALNIGKGYKEQR
jgi:hypothetical protein